MLNFKKMHGLGNDFVILDARVADISLSAEQIRYICDRKRGVGADQLILIEISEGFQETAFMRMFNSDGSIVRACGNATRCVADLLMTEEGMQSVVIETISGMLNCRRADGGLITVDMGKPKFGWRDIPLSKEMDTAHLPLMSDAVSDPVAVNIGNPHCIFFVDSLEAIFVEQEGKRFEVDPLFPDRVNVEFVQVSAPDHVRMRVWERGAGITDACGSGACAVVVASVLRGLTERKVVVTLDGGDLTIEWPDDDAQVSMTGPVSYVFDGKILDI